MTLMQLWRASTIQAINALQTGPAMLLVGEWRIRRCYVKHCLFFNRPSLYYTSRVKAVVQPPLHRTKSPARLECQF